MGFVQTQGASDDVDLRLLDVVERLAAEFEDDVGIGPIADEVQRSRDLLRLEHRDEADHMDLVESIARDALAQLRADPGRLSAIRLSGHPKPYRTARYNVGGAAAVEYALLVSLLAAVIAGMVAMIGLKINVMFVWVDAGLSRVLG